MLFWKFTRSGKFSSKYISLIMDFHASLVEGNFLKTNFEECKDILYLIQDVETLNGLNNNSAGLEKQAIQEQVNKLGFKTNSIYEQQREKQHLVLGQMTLGVHGGTPLDYGMSNKQGKQVLLDIRNLKYVMMIDAKTGIVYGTEDKLKAYRTNKLFINEGRYFDWMPLHSCIVEIVTKMLECDTDETIKFLKECLKWEVI